MERHDLIWLEITFEKEILEMMCSNGSLKNLKYLKRAALEAPLRLLSPDSPAREAPQREVLRCESVLRLLTTTCRITRRADLIREQVFYFKARQSQSREIGNLLPNNQRQRRTCYALCHILYPVSAAHTSIFRMDSNSTSYIKPINL